jgi:hypothetical protein
MGLGVGWLRQGYEEVQRTRISRQTYTCLLIRVRWDFPGERCDHPTPTAVPRRTV